MRSRQSDKYSIDSPLISRKPRSILGEVPEDTKRYDLGELPGNAREICRNWVATVDAKYKTNVCQQIKASQKKSIQASQLQESAAMTLGKTQIVTSVSKAAVATTKMIAAVAEYINPVTSTNALSSLADATNIMIDSVQSEADAAYSFSQAEIVRVEREAQLLNGVVDQYNECARPSATEINCGIGQLSYKIDRFLPAIDSKLDALMLTTKIMISSRNIREEAFFFFFGPFFFLFSIPFVAVSLSGRGVIKWASHLFSAIYLFVG